MAGIIKTSINLTAIPKDKIITGKKGKYLPISISLVIKAQLPLIKLKRKEKLKNLKLT